MAEPLVEELLQLNQCLLESIALGDWETYQSLCDPSLTAFEPEAVGQLVAGLDFHRFYFELGGVQGPHHTTQASPHVRVALLEVEHQIGDALTGSVIGVAAAAAGGVDRKTSGIEQLGGIGAGAGGVERGVLEQPDELAGPAVPDRRDPLLHHGQRLGIGDEVLARAPLDGRIERPGWLLQGLTLFVRSRGPVGDPAGRHIMRSWRNW